MTNKEAEKAAVRLNTSGSHSFYASLLCCKDNKNSANHQVICGVFLYSCVICPKNLYTSMFSSSSSWLWLVWVVISSMPWKCSPRNPLTTEQMRSDNSKAAKSSVSSPKVVLPTQSVTMCSDTVPSPRIALGCPPSRADCVSFTKELIEELFLRTETSYLRASSCSSRREMYDVEAHVCQWREDGG